MIDVWTWPTPNGHKVHIALEELGLPYRVIPVDIGAGDQFKPEFLAITPNHRIPAIVDPDGPGGQPLTLFESGAILIYLAEKTGRLMPADPQGRLACLQWLMFQMGGVGPMFGQYNHFAVYAPEKLPYAIERYSNEVRRLHRFLDKRLQESEFLAGPDYGIADIATFPWIRNPDRRGINLADYPAVQRWHDAIAARPAVQRGGAVGQPAQGADHRRRTRGDVRQDAVRGALRRRRGLLDLGFLERNVLASDRVVLLQLKLAGRRAGVLLGDVEVSGVRGGDQPDLDGVVLSHDRVPDASHPRVRRRAGTWSRRAPRSSPAFAVPFRA